MDNTISERKARYMKDKKTLSVGIDKDLYNALVQCARGYSERQKLDKTLYHRNVVVQICQR